jgi:hypothetical protein
MPRCLAAVRACVQQDVVPQCGRPPACSGSAGQLPSSHALVARMSRPPSGLQCRCALDLLRPTVHRLGEGHIDPERYAVDLRREPRLRGGRRRLHMAWAWARPRARREPNPQRRSLALTAADSPPPAGVPPTQGEVIMTAIAPTMKVSGSMAAPFGLPATRRIVQTSRTIFASRGARHALPLGVEDAEQVGTHSGR